MCENQGEIAQYTFLVAEKHKALKIEKEKRSANITKLIKLKDDLDKFHPTEFHRIMQKNHKYIQNFLPKGKNGHSPRVVIKWCSNDEIGDLYRHKFDYYCKEKVSDNSGAQTVYRTGEHYLRNDLCKEVLENDYKNSRLDNIKVKELAEEKGYENITHNDWKKCWLPNIDDVGNQIPAPDDSCYRSTMLIPLTLLNNELNEEFRRHFEIPIRPERSVK